MPMKGGKDMVSHRGRRGKNTEDAEGRTQTQREEHRGHNEDKR